MTQNEGKPVVDVLAENGISMDVISNLAHPDFPAQRQKLIQLLQDQQITEQQIHAIQQSIPATVDALAQVSSDAKDSQIASVGAISESNARAFDIILQIVKDAQTDEMRLEALRATERMNAENNSTIKDVSKDNNLTFKNIAIAVFGGLLLLAGGAAAAKALTR